MMDKSILEKRIHDKAEERYGAELYSDMPQLGDDPVG